MRKSLIQAALIVFFLLLVGGISWYHDIRTPYSEAASIGQNVTSFSDLSDRFAKLANDKGAVYAFDVLKIAKLPPETDLHLLGHVVGDILYKQQGVSGIQYCTQDFRNACSHTIAIGALNEYGGEGALPLIHDACLKAPGGEGAYTMCYHGLGHGVFAYFGYDLPKTVSFCKKTGTPQYHDQEFTQCVSGAIMELISGGGHDPQDWTVANKKYLVPSDPLSPCMSALIPYEAKTMCLVYLTPELFTRAGADLANPSPDTFPKAFSFCNAIPTSEQPLRDACYGGFGKEFIPLVAARDIRSVDTLSDDQYKTAISWCEMAGDARGSGQCVSQAVASVFWGGENNSDGAFRLCLLATGASQAACYQGLGEEIEQYTSGERESSLCARFPEEFRKECVVSAAKI